MGKVVVGHAVHNDFKVLSYTHPAALTRDTSRIPLLNLKAGFVENECASLKRLTKAIFNRDIQVGDLICWIKERKENGYSFSSSGFVQVDNFASFHAFLDYG